jgi:hypothetical protein
MPPSSSQRRPKTRKEIQCLIAERFPQPDVPDRGSNYSVTCADTAAV